MKTIEGEIKLTNLTVTEKVTVSEIRREVKMGDRKLKLTSNCNLLSIYNIFYKNYTSTLSLKKIYGNILQKPCSNYHFTINLNYKIFH